MNRLSSFMLGQASEVSVGQQQAPQQADKELRIQLEAKNYQISELQGQIQTFQSQLGDRDVQLMKRTAEANELRG